MVIRFGDIQFINSWPVTYALRERLIGLRGTGLFMDIISAVPSELNAKLLAGELDGGAVSTIEYLRHQDEFVPVPGACIRSDKAVASVIVMSREPLEQIEEGAIAVSNQGATTPVLLKLLLQQKDIKLRTEQTALRYPKALEQYPAALLIGDEALAAAAEAKTKRLHAWDLGIAWSDWTGMPFVYALWVVRRSIAEKNPEMLRQIARSFTDSRRWGQTHERELIGRIQEKFPWPRQFIKDYLDNLSYDLDEKAWAGIARFAHEARGIKELILPVSEEPAQLAGTR